MLKHSVNKKGITSASGTKALTLSFKVPTTLFGLVLSSVHRGAFRLLNDLCCLEVGHLGHQQTVLRLSSCLLFHKPLLGQVSPSDGID
jgi:hypothetical protein